MAAMSFSGDGFQKGLFHGTPPPLMSSFPGLARFGAGVRMMEYRHIFRAGMFLVAMAGAVAPISALAQPGGDKARELMQRGQAREASGAHDEALVDLTQAIEMRILPAIEQGRALFDRGLILDAQGRLNEALGDYTAALKLTPRFTPALNNRANVYRRQNRLADARADYLASLAAGNPQPEYSWYGLGAVAEAEGDVATARQNYARAVAANPAYKLAADRLAALGGKPDATRDDIITLRPPRAFVAAESGPIVLKPPPVKSAAQEPVQARPAPSSPPPAPLTPVQGPDLRPALNDTVPAGAMVQLGSWRTQVEAEAGWAKILRQADGLLDGLSSRIVAADLPGRGRYYRLRAGPVQDAPGRLCEALIARGLACIPARD